MTLNHHQFIIILRKGTRYIFCPIIDYFPIPKILSRFSPFFLLIILLFLCIFFFPLIFCFDLPLPSFSFLLPFIYFYFLELSFSSFPVWHANVSFSRLFTFSEKINFFVLLYKIPSPYQVCEMGRYNTYIPITHVWNPHILMRPYSDSV